MSMHKKLKLELSGFTGLELRVAIQALTTLKNSLIYDSEEVTPGPQDVDAGKSQAGESLQEERVDIFDERLEGMIQLMQSKLEQPLVRGHVSLSHLLQSGMTDQMLQDDMHITFLGFLDLKDQLEARIKETSLLGKDQLWCSDNMYRHLAMLELHVSRSTEASARAWIDTFFFRAIAMVSPTHRMVLNMEYNVPSTTIRPQSFATISGRTDYKAIIAKPGVATALLTRTHTQMLSLERYVLSSFFVAEGKPGELARFVPQAVSEIYGCAKVMNKDILRGALTNGREWIFLIVSRKRDRDGATYKASFVHTYDIFHKVKHSLPDIVKPQPDLIAGILSYWIEHSFDDISTDDWFEDCNLKE